jgi:6-phosphogluconolactonase
MIRGERWIGENAHAVAREGARRFVAAAKEATGERGRFTVALAGGSTPKAMYQLLAEPQTAAQVAWGAVEVLFGDERAVPPDHPDSNYGMAARALLDRVPLDPARVHRIEGERDDAAERYEALLGDLFGNALPEIDLVLLGMGPDGHTASLFPHTPALHEQARWCAKNPVQKLATQRFTLTAPILNAARRVVLTVCGAEKAAVVRAIAADAEDPEEHPVLLVRPTRGELAWLFDRAAAGDSIADGKKPI